MEKETLKQRLITGLTRDGYKPVPSKSNKFSVFGKPGTASTNMYVGKSGSLRLGNTASDSVPAHKDVKNRFLALGAKQAANTKEETKEKILEKLTKKLAEAEMAEDTKAATAAKKDIVGIEEIPEYEWHYVYVDDSISTIGGGWRHLMVQNVDHYNVRLTESTGDTHIVSNSVFRALSKKGSTRSTKGPKKQEPAATAVAATAKQTTSSAERTALLELIDAVNGKTISELTAAMVLPVSRVRRLLRRAKRAGHNIIEVEAKNRYKLKK